MTVSENIAIGKIKDIQNKPLIRKAALMSGANQFIEKLPKKYQQILGNAFANGEQLSIEIIVLKDGAIIERGTHDELYLKNGEYAQMFNLQAEAYK